MLYVYNPHSQEIEQSTWTSTNFSTDVIFSAWDNETLNWTSWQVITSDWQFTSVAQWTTLVSWLTYVYFDYTNTLKVTNDIANIQWNILLATANDTIVWTDLIISTEANAWDSVLIWNNNIEPDAITTSKILDWTITPEKLSFNPGGTLQQWTWFADTTYLYTVFWVDGDWEALRYTRTLLTETTTWVQIWTKPTTLEEVQLLVYN